MIREPKFEELDEMLELLKLAYRGTSNSNIEPDRTYLARNLLYCLNFPNFFIRIAEHKGKIVGVLAAVIEKNIYGERTAQSLVSFSLCESQGLIGEYKQWAEGQGVSNIVLTTMEGDDMDDKAKRKKERYSELAKDLGFKKAGSIMVLQGV